MLAQPSFEESPCLLFAFQKISGKTVIRKMESGDFPGYKIGSAWKFRRGDIEQYRESRKFVGTPTKEQSDH
jgi:hypothetical protein